MQKKHGGLCLSDKFTKLNNSYEWKDKNGNIFHSSWANVKRNNKLEKSTVSNGHQDIIDYLLSIGVDNIKINVRTVINPKEIDIYCPDYNIGIEYNGLMYHHTGNKGITTNYHQNKFLLAEEKNIQLLQIYDIEWNKRKKQVKSFLRAKFGKCKNRLYARECMFKEIPLKEANEFLDQYHIIGKVRNGTAYGLFKDKELVCVTTIGNHPNQQNDNKYLTRFCGKDDVYVIGGLNKLTKNIIRLINKDLYTWVDLRYSNGVNWQKANWEFVHITKPIISYYDTNYKKLYRKKPKLESYKYLKTLYDAGKRLYKFNR